MNNDIAIIVEFFMNLYKQQLEAPKDAPSEIVPVNPASCGPDYVHELHVERDDGQRVSRRMTIAMLGEGSGSKSKCFKVIYDDLLVVKVPPIPISDFDEYIRNIKAETHVAVKLAPRIEFVAPRVTALLRKLHTLPDSADIAPSELENRYIEWLKEHPDFQEYLKINEGFAFFMDLSKYSFLSYVVEKIHDKKIFKNKMREEIVESHNLLWDILEFEGKYGSENLSIYFDMNKIYSDYEIKIRQLLRQYECAGMVSSYEKQQWFLVYLAEKEVREIKSSVPVGFIEDLNRLLSKIVEEYKDVIIAYKKAVSKYVDKASFMQSRAKISGIITNLLELLAALQETGVAIRDLKPDNLFVVGNADLSAEDYSLGLIDFETAVEFFDISGGNSLKIQQPLLAGTPSYSTPSHLFRNEFLTEVFDDLPYILHFQDWQATVGMIFHVAVGECLFEKTRRLLGKIPLAARQAFEKKQPMSKVFKKSSQIFWSSAIKEFKEKLAAKENILKSVEVNISKKGRQMLLNDLLKEKEAVSKKINKYVVSQVIFSSPKDRKSLIQSSLEKIIEYRTKLEKGGIPKTPLEIRDKIVGLLQGLEKLKNRSENQERMLKLLEPAKPRISVYEVLEIMFSLILKSMYKEEWGPLSEEYEVMPSGSDGKFFRETTVVYEDSVIYENGE